MSLDNFAIVGPASDIGVSFNTITGPGGVQVSFHGASIVGLVDARNAIYASRRLSQAARVTAEGRVVLTAEAGQSEDSS